MESLLLFIVLEFAGLFRSQLYDELFNSLNRFDKGVHLIKNRFVARHNIMNSGDVIYDIAFRLFYRETITKACRLRVKTLKRLLKFKLY